MVTISTGMSLRNAVDISSSQPVPLHLWLFYFCSNFKGMKILEITNGIKVLTETKACYAAAAKSLQSCLTLCDPIDGSPPGSPVLGFSRQEHWSGLPFPSPMHESEKWKWSRSVLSDPQRPHGLQPTTHLRPWDFLGKNTGIGCHFLLIHHHLSPSPSPPLVVHSEN